MATIKGQNLRILITPEDGEELCIAASTSCTVHVSVQMEDSSTKDSENSWTENEPVGLNWDVSVDALVTIDEEEEDTGAHRLDALTVGETYTVKFSQTAGETGEQNRDAIDNVLQFTGTAILTDLSVTAPNRQNSTFTAQFTGNGELEQYSE